jgi:hypothetical protein
MMNRSAKYVSTLDGSAELSDATKSVLQGSIVDGPWHAVLDLGLYDTDTLCFYTIGSLSLPFEPS